MALTAMPKLFNKAGTTGFVFFFKRGVAKSKGLAYGGLIGPRTMVAVVPMTPQILDFSISARSSDLQNIMVCGNVKVGFRPDLAVRQFDFTVDADSGGYLSPWQQVLRSVVVEGVLDPIRRETGHRTVHACIAAHDDLKQAIEAEIAAVNGPLREKGINVDSCSVTKVYAEDNEVERAIGAKERQDMLASADKALHDRRIAASTNEREVKMYEQKTAELLEEERSALLVTQGENKQKEASDDAAAQRMRFDAFTSVPAEKLLGMALLEMAKTGKIGQLSIVPELLAALQQRS